ncbi:MAG: GHMP kinase [Candidatus Eremiobacterota bacterium]
MIESFAPVRIDLAGGTLDIYPLYIFEDSGITVNIAINLMSHVQIIPGGNTFRFHSKDMNLKAETDNLNSLFDGNFDLIARAVKFYCPESPMEIITHNPIPKGSGLGASSSLLMALSGALNRLSGKGYDKTQIIDIGANIEAKSIKIPTGKQDYYAAVYGGVNAIWFKYDGVEVEKLLKEEKDIKELEKRIILTYTGESRFSGTNNWEMMKRYIDGKAVGPMKNIKKTAEKMRLSIINKDFSSLSYILAEEWENRKNLAEGVTTEKIEFLMEKAGEAGAMASKICGAGGGGCMLSLVEPEKKEHVVSALEEGGAKVMEFSIDNEGIRVLENCNG